MKFGSVPVEAALGAILAHALKLDDGRIGKGTRLSAGDIARLRAAGVGEVVAAVLDDGDLTEDEAAARIGAAAAGLHIEAGPAGTGRVNFFAEANGVFLPDKVVVDGLNAIDPGITLATLGAFARVEAGRMVATVKIIPLAVPGEAVTDAVSLLSAAPAFRVAAFRPRRVGLIQTELPGVKKSVLDKTRAVLERRLDASGSSVVWEARCAHHADALAGAIGMRCDVDLVVVFGASAVIDAEDVIPTAIKAAGGDVLHLGMPVDPGNLLLLGHLTGTPVIGAPGCARSPKENGFDWILDRLIADVPVTGDDIRGMGVGGLLMEIASRPQPRAMIATSVRSNQAAHAIVDVVILAAGRSSRMGGPNKLLATFEGVPLVRRSVETALASRGRRVRVVVGHMRAAIVAALDGLDVEIVENVAFAAGLSTSLVAGVEACSPATTEAADGVLVMLADQPFLTSSDLDRLIAAFSPEGQGSIVAATCHGRRGNPVVLSRLYGDAIRALTGDVGAKAIVAANEVMLREVEIGEAAAVDVDTPDAMVKAGGRWDNSETLVNRVISSG